MPERIEQLSAINLRWAPTVLHGDAQMSVSWDGVPLPAGSLPRRIGEHKMGRTGYEEKFLPAIGPGALYGLLFTTVILFAPQYKTITCRMLHGSRCPCACISPSCGLEPSLSARPSHSPTTAPRPWPSPRTAGNNFELAAAIATFGVTSGQALSGLVGPSSKFPSSQASSTPPPCSPVACSISSPPFAPRTSTRTPPVAFHDPARYADGCATHPIPAWAHLFLRAAACFATLTDGFWPAKATGLSRYASPRAPNLPPPQPLAPQQTEPGRVVWDWKERKEAERYEPLLTAPPRRPASSSGWSMRRDS